MATGGVRVVVRIMYAIKTRALQAFIYMAYRIDWFNPSPKKPVIFAHDRLQFALSAALNRREPTHSGPSDPAETGR